MKDARGHGSNAKPIPGHRYHSLSDMELRYIQKDAHEAGRNAHEMGDQRGVNKYADQVNDAATVLGYRSRGGKSDAPADQLHSGTPKSDAAPVHDSMTHNSNGHAWGSPEALADFKAAYGGRGGEDKAFRRGAREINELKKRGK